MCGVCLAQVLQNILEAESEFSRELQSLLASYLRSLHPTDRCRRLAHPIYCARTYVELANRVMTMMMSLFLPPLARRAASALLTSATFRGTWRRSPPSSSCWFSPWRSTPSQYSSQIRFPMMLNQSCIPGVSNSHTQWWIVCYSLEGPNIIALRAKFGQSLTPMHCPLHHLFCKSNCLIICHI